jgi:quercetin dioxygenase-like cupin family protein
MKFIKARDVGWQDKGGYSKKVLLNGKDLNFPGVLVQEIKIKARDIAASHFHKKQTEIFYFLNSNGFFTINGAKIVPEIGDITVVEPNDKHIVTNNTDEDFLYLAFKINYDEKDIYWD